MNLRSKTSRSEQSLSQDLIISLPISLLAAHIFVGFRQEENYFKIIFVDGYLPAFIASSIIAYLLFFIVKRITRYLDKKHPWDEGKIMRLVKQFILGFSLTLFIGFLFSSAYFASFGISIFDTVYFDSYLMPIALFIVIINMFYNSGYPASQPVKTSELPADVPELSAEETILKNKEILETFEASRPAKIEAQHEPSAQSKHPLDIAKYAEMKNVAYISISKKSHYARDVNGDHIIWFRNLTASIAALPRDQYFLITRNCIIRRDIVRDLEIDPLAHTLAVVLKEPFGEPVNVPAGQIEAFKAWWLLK